MNFWYELRFITWFESLVWAKIRNMIWIFHMRQDLLHGLNIWYEQRFVTWFESLKWANICHMVWIFDMTQDSSHGLNLCYHPRFVTWFESLLIWFESLLIFFKFIIWFESLLILRILLSFHLIITYFFPFIFQISRNTTRISTKRIWMDI